MTWYSIVFDGLFCLFYFSSFLRKLDKKIHLSLDGRKVEFLDPSFDIITFLLLLKFISLQKEAQIRCYFASFFLND